MSGGDDDLSDINEWLNEVEEIFEEESANDIIREINVKWIDYYIVHDRSMLFSLKIASYGIPYA